ncbi:hypothetical protein [Stenotrophomonas sp. Marseille-Q4652]|uniref:hypothetical protein n=1 Tax=Stenotrophomonas sp. Marseille-Q4652 TaxID=2866595 RepID=UPI001CE49165|nr:hypothetical protein [Stenotrophomonas sp. Marseille-Q4652]
MNLASIADLRLLLMLVSAIVLTGCTAKAELTMVPEVVRECEAPVATRVIWDVSPLGLQKATLEINNIGQPRKFWEAGGAKGSAEAPAWAQDGYTVTLVSANGVVLARRTLMTVPCK